MTIEADQRGAVVTLDVHGTQVKHRQGLLLPASFYLTEAIPADFSSNLDQLAKDGYRRGEVEGFIQRGLLLDPSQPTSEQLLERHTGKILLTPEQIRQERRGKALLEDSNTETHFVNYNERAVKDFVLDDEECRDIEDLSQVARLVVVTNALTQYIGLIAELLNPIEQYISEYYCRPYPWTNRRVFKRVVHAGLSVYERVIAKTDDVLEGSDIEPNCEMVAICLDKEDASKQPHLEGFGLQRYSSTKLTYGRGANRRIIESIQ
jgi:hypothetical protein